MNIWPATRKWRTNQRLEGKRRDWLVTVLLDYVAPPRYGKGPSSNLHLHACRGLPLTMSTRSHSAICGATGSQSRFAPGVSPTDPVEAGEEVVVKAPERRGADLARQAESFRPRADNRAPDGGRWSPWAMEHPESGITPEEADDRDFQAGYFEQWGALSTSYGINLVRGQLRRSRWVSEVSE